MKKLLLAVFALCAATVNAARDNELDWIATPKGGYVVMPPTSVTDGAVSKISWSPDGNYLLVVERPNVLTQEQALLTGVGYSAGTTHLLGWDRDYQRVRNMWTSEDPTQTIESIDWIRGSSAAYVTFRWTVEQSPNGASHAVYGVMWLDANTAKFAWVAGMERLVSRPHIFPSPTRPQAAATFSDNPADDSNGISSWVTASGGSSGQSQSFTITIQGGSNDLARDVTTAIFGLLQAQPKANNYWTLDASGGVKNAIKIDHTLDLPLVWNQDGSAWFLREQDKDTGKQVLSRLTNLGNLGKTSEIEFVAVERPHSLSTETKNETSALGKAKTNFVSLWLKSSEPREHGELNLTPNGNQPELSPTESAVFYIDGGVAKVRTLIALSTEQIKRIQAAAHNAPLGQTNSTFTLSQPIQLRIFSGDSTQPPTPVP